MAVTRSGLAPASIYKDGGSPRVDCMFNPAEYSLTKANNYSPGTDVGQTTARRQFKSGDPRSLSVKLFFDTYQDGPAAEPVTKYTDNLFAMMTVEAGGTNREPPDIIFKWGTFEFKGRLTNVQLQFTLFNKEGTPLRATATISMIERPDVIIAAQTASRAWEGRTEMIDASKSLATIAASATGDANNWRAIAEVNNIEDPKKLKSGAVVKVATSKPAEPPAAEFSASINIGGFSASVSLKAPRTP